MRSLRISLVVVLMTLGYVSCSETTGGNLVTVPFQVAGVERSAPAVTQCADPLSAECSADETPLEFTTPTLPDGGPGWNVTLTKARAVLGPFYFNVVGPPTQGFRDGTVIMEVLEQAIVDPLDPNFRPVPVGGNVPVSASGETGTAVSVEIDLFPPNGDQCGCNKDTLLLSSSGEESQAYVRGTATRGTSTVPFAGWITLDSSLATQLVPIQYLQRIAGADVKLNFTSSQQLLTLRVDPSHWFDQTDFSVFPSLSPGVGADGGVGDAGVSDAGTADAGLGAEGYSLIDIEVSGQKERVYTWTNHSTFHSQLVGGFETTTGVYDFTLSGP